MLRKLLPTLLLLAAACQAGQPLPTPTPPASLQPLVVAFTPALQPLSPALQACTRHLPGLALTVEEVPAASLPDAGAGLQLYLGPQPIPGSTTIALADESLAVVVNPRNPINALSAEDLAALFLGEVERWADLPGGRGGAPAIWDYPEGNELRTLFSTAVLDAAPWPNPNLNLAPDPAAMLQAVAADPSSIGYLPAAWLNTDVKALRLGPDLAASLQVPILATATSPPAGPARPMLECLQSGVGHDLLQDLYTPQEGS